MKVRCNNCNRIYYVEEGTSFCENCGERLEHLSIPGVKQDCPIAGQEVKLINGLPTCDHFRLVNSMGHRCTQQNPPGSCALCGQKIYDPRVGIAS